MTTENSSHTISTLKELADEKIKHVREVADLQFRLNQIALDKAEAVLAVKMEAAQKEVAPIRKLVYVGLGLVLAFEFYSNFIK